MVLACAWISSVYHCCTRDPGYKGSVLFTPSSLPSYDFKSDFLPAFSEHLYLVACVPVSTAL